MIRRLRDEDYDLIMDYLKKEMIINYFIVLSLEMTQGLDLFERAWGQFNRQGELSAILLKRKTGNMQFYSREDYDVEVFSHILRVEGFKQLLGEEKILERFQSHYAFSNIEKGAFVSRLDHSTRLNMPKQIYPYQRVGVEHVDRIIELYRQIFKGFTTRQSMMKRYEQRTGRGYYVEKEGKIICVAQSAYEQKDTALIVGVGTHPEYRNQGYASGCMYQLCDELLGEGKNLYLQYDNPEAGKIYRAMGFEDVGRMLLCHN